MIARVEMLQAGDLVSSGLDRAVFLARTEHPLNPRFQLVIWRLLSGDGAYDIFSFDMLVPEQEVGELYPATPDERIERFKRAIT